MWKSLKKKQRNRKSQAEKEGGILPAAWENLENFEVIYVKNKYQRKKTMKKYDWNDGKQQSDENEREKLLENTMIYTRYRRRNYGNIYRKIIINDMEKWLNEEEE